MSIILTGGGVGVPWSLDVERWLLYDGSLTFWLDQRRLRVVVTRTWVPIRRFGKSLTDCEALFWAPWFVSGSIILTDIGGSFQWSFIGVCIFLDDNRSWLPFSLACIDIIASNRWVWVWLPFILASKSNLFIFHVIVCPWLVCSCIILSWFRILFFWPSIRWCGSFYYCRFWLMKCLRSVDIISTNWRIWVWLPLILGS